MKAGSKISEELEQSNLSEEEENEKYTLIVGKPAKVVTKIVGEDEWGEYDMKKKDNAGLTSSHTRTGSAAGSFIPVNHRQRASVGDPNYGWGGVTSSSEIELATIVPPSPNLAPRGGNRRR